MGRESVRGRMGSDEGISFTEFSYQLLQAHDFAHLRAHHGCDLQLGGSDQWGNITAGVDHIRKTQDAARARPARCAGGGAAHARSQTAVGITIPLLTTAGGDKIGKSAGNAVWLAPHKTTHVRGR